MYFISSDLWECSSGCIKGAMKPLWACCWRREQWWDYNGSICYDVLYKLVSTSIGIVAAFLKINLSFFQWKHAWTCYNRWCSITLKTYELRKNTIRKKFIYLQNQLGCSDKKGVFHGAAVALKYLLQRVEVEPFSNTWNLSCAHKKVGLAILLLLFARVCSAD
jgi:hypothetical protein